MNEKEFSELNVFGKGVENQAYAKYFTGKSFINPLLPPDEAPIGIFNLTFEPGCRNDWHIHHASKGGGQMLEAAPDGS